MLGVGLLAISFNIYTSFLRYPLHRWRGGTKDDFQWVSGAPLIGSLFTWVSLPLLEPPVGWLWVGLAFTLLDTGGIHCFVVMMLYQAITKRRPSSKG